LQAVSQSAFASALHSAAHSEPQLVRQSPVALVSQLAAIAVPMSPWHMALRSIIAQAKGHWSLAVISQRWRNAPGSIAADDS
jgi:hypothetical protein